MLKYNHLKYICKLIYDSFFIPIYLLDEHGDILYETTNNSVFPSDSNKREYLEKLFHSDELSKLPILKTSKYMESFIIIPLHSDNYFIGNIIVGPSISVKLTDYEIELLMHDLKREFTEDIVAYYRLLPTHSELQFINISLQIFYMVYGKMIDLEDVLEYNKQHNRTELEIDEPQVLISKNRERENLHHTIYYERKILECVKKGQKDELIKSKNAFLSSGEMGILAKESFLRSQKNLGISIITLATRAAIDGGVHYELAYTLSDLYIQNIEEISNSSDLDKFLDKALLDFTGRSKKSHKRYSKPINDCLDYIFSHLYDELPLSTFSKLTKLHPNYLSTLFHKEVGIPLNIYIQKIKIDEAKTLIQYTKYTLAEIANLLNFYDQSYFSKTFKKFVGVTPSQFRKEL